MPDRHDVNGHALCLDGVDHSEVATPSRVQSIQRRAERFAHPLRIRGQRSEDELEARSCYGLGQVELDRPRGLSRPGDLMDQCVPRLEFGNPSRTSSVESTSPA